MSVNVGQRNIPKTPKVAQCYAVDSAVDLLCHTLRNCKNKVFLNDYKDTVTDKVTATATEIYLSSYKANRIRVLGEEDFERRQNLQRDSIERCDELIALIYVAKRVFHLRKNKTEFWVNKIIETRELIKKWKQSDKERYKSKK